MKDPNSELSPEVNGNLFRFPCSYAQQRLWFLNQLEPTNPNYNIGVGVRLIGQLDVEVLERVLSEVVRRHESLRTTFVEFDGEAVQMVSTEGEFELGFDDLSTMPAQERQPALERLVREVAQLPFDLRMGPLFRCRLVRMAKDEHVALLTMHHIISDGWSLGVLVREVSTLYDAYARGLESPLDESPVQYADYAVWQREWLQGKVLKQQLDYWRKQLAELPVLELPADYPRPKEPSRSGARRYFTMGAELSERLREMAREEGATLFMVLLAGFALLLRRYTGERDLAVGTPVANRTRGEIEGLIGFFVNTLVLRVEISGAESFRELLQRVKGVCLKAYAHQEVPFERVVEEVKPERNLGRTPLFQVLFALQNAGEAAGGGRLKLAGLELEPMEVYNQTAKFDLTVTLVEGAEGLSGAAEYSTDLFEEESIVRLLEHYVRLLEEATAAPEQAVRSLPLLSEAEREQIVREWNASELELGEAASLTELFEAEAKRRPEAVAMRAGAEELSYGELNGRANQLAAHLRQQGVGAEKLVGVCVERSVGMVVALLAVLKAGGAYVPLDPGYPAERLRYMVEDAGVELVIRGASVGSAVWEGVKEVKLEECSAEVGQYSTEDVQCGVSGEQLAYVIYTSGSTGRPKGVMVSHRAISNHLLWRQETYPLCGSDRFLHKASSSFDISVWEIMAPLTSGAQLVLAAGGGEKDSAYLVRAIAEQRITMAHFGPAMLRAFLEEPGVEECCSLRHVFCGGEPLTQELAELFFRRVGARLHQQYGPTEATVDVTVRECAPGERRERIPIGRPIGNARVYLLDSELQPVPQGVPAELYLGGLPLARGYLNRPALTAERFVPDPFSSEPGARLYRTGDEGRYLKDGQIEYLGRRDRQVKLRGYRIELGEIESVLASHSEIREAVVIVKTGSTGDRRLEACVVARENPVSIDELRDWVKSKLPDYMAPSAFVWLDHVPLTKNGKVDRRALDALDAPQTQAQTFVPPRTEFEKLIAGVWAEVLGVESVGLYDNFFELGGHSLLATQVMSRLRRVGIDLPLRTLFDASTLSALATKAETELRGEPALPILPTPKRAAINKGLPLSFAQERLWFMHVLAPGDTAYNLATAFRLFGHLDLDALEKSLTEMARRHEGLRTTFARVDGRPIQLISEANPLKVAPLDLSGLPEQQRNAEVRRLSQEQARIQFDLSVGPLWRVMLVRLDSEEHIVFVTMHHIITDGWSLGIFTRDLVTLYRSFSQNEPSLLPQLPIQYADFAVWQRNWLRGEVLDQQLDYWRAQLSGAPPVLKLPLDHPRPAALSSRGARVSFQLEFETTRSLQQLSRRAGVTLFMTLLAAFKTLLQRYTGQEDIVVGTDIANRNRTEVEDLIGFFVNMLVLRTDLSGDPTFVELLARVREVALGAYAHQDLPFTRLVDELQIPRGTSHSPLFQVVFVVQNAPVGEAKLPVLTIEPLPIETEAVPFDLVFSMWEAKDVLSGSLSYRTDLFERATVERMIKHLRHLLGAIVRDPEQRLSGLSLLAKDDVREFIPETISGVSLSQKELEDVILELQRTSAE